MLNWMRLSLLGLVLVCLPGCGHRTGDFRLSGDEVAIDFVNETPGGVRVFLNDIDFGDVSAFSSETFIVPAGVYAVAIDRRGDGLDAREPFQFVGLRVGQTTLMVFR